MFFRTLILLISAGVAYAADPPAVDTKKAADLSALVDSGLKAAMAKDYAKSEQLFIQATQLASSYGATDPRYGSTENSLGMVYREEKKYGEAEKAFEKALSILEKAYGPDSIDAGNVTYNLSTVLIASDRYDAALPYVLRSNNIFRQRLGDGSMKTADTMCMLGEVYRNQKKFVEAESPLKKCADIRERAGGVESPELADALFNLGLVYQHLGKFALADPTLKLTEKIRELTLGINNPKFAEALEAHGALLRAMGREKDAARDETLALAVRRNGKK